MNVKIEESWRKRLQEEFDKPYFEKLVAFVKVSMDMPTCYLPAINFPRLQLLPVREVKSSYSDKTLILIPVSIMESAFPYRKE